MIRGKSSGQKFRIGDEVVTPRQGEEMGRGMAVGRGRVGDHGISGVAGGWAAGRGNWRGRGV